VFGSNKTVVAGTLYSKPPACFLSIMLKSLGAVLPPIEDKL